MLRELAMLVAAQREHQQHAMSHRQSIGKTLAPKSKGHTGCSPAILENSELLLLSQPKWDNLNEHSVPQQILEEASYVDQYCGGGHPQEDKVELHCQPGIPQTLKFNP